MSVGDYEIKATYVGYREFTDNISISPESELTFNIFIEPVEIEVEIEDDTINKSFILEQVNYIYPCFSLVSTKKLKPWWN